MYLNFFITPTVEEIKLFKKWSTPFNIIVIHTSAVSEVSESYSYTNLSKIINITAQL